MNPLEKKLRLHKMNSITLLNFPKEITFLDHLETNKKLQKKQDCIISFVEDLEAMKQLILKTVKDDSVNDQGVLFIVYPKLKNKLNKKGIHRDDILPYIKVDPDGDGFVDETHLKFNQMVSFDENYTCVGLKYFETIPKTKPTVSMRWLIMKNIFLSLKKT